MSGFATVTKNSLLELQLLRGILWLSTFMFPLLLLTVETQNAICNSLLAIFITSWQSLKKIG